MSHVFLLGVEGEGLFVVVYMYSLFSNATPSPPPSFFPNKLFFINALAVKYHK